MEQRMCSQRRLQLWKVVSSAFFPETEACPQGAISRRRERRVRVDAQRQRSGAERFRVPVVGVQIPSHSETLSP